MGSRAQSGYTVSHGQNLQKKSFPSLRAPTDYPTPTPFNTPRPRGNYDAPPVAYGDGSGDTMPNSGSSTGVGGSGGGGLNSGENSGMPGGPGARSPPEGSYEAACVGFAKYLNSPMTCLVAGRGNTQVMYLIHTSILQPHPLLYKLCKAPQGQGGKDTNIAAVTTAPTSATASAGQSMTNLNSNVTQMDLRDISSPNTQVLLKDYEPQIVSSLLAFLYTGEYWPEMVLLKSHGGEDGVLEGVNMNAERVVTHGGVYSSLDLFTAHNVMIHHFRLALLASKFSIEPLLLMCREKVMFCLVRLPPREMLEVVRMLYSKECVYREHLFELITCPWEVENGNGGGKGRIGGGTGRDRIWPGASFWTREILEKLMSEEGGRENGYRAKQESGNVNEVGQMDGYAGNGALDEGDGGVGDAMDEDREVQVSVKEQFLAMVGDHGGDLARDVVKAFWQAGLGIRVGMGMGMAMGVGVGGGGGGSGGARQRMEGLQDGVGVQGKVSAQCPHEADGCF